MVSLFSHGVDVLFGLHLSNLGLELELLFALF